jgi:PhnB protein
VSATITPYLMFGGRCDEALEFYKHALGAETEMVMRFSDSPEQPPPGMLAPGFEKKVMHCSFRVGGARVMASDGCAPAGAFAEFRLNLQLPDEAAARKAFDALAAGGEVEMPLTPTFWSPCYGMLTDKFGLGWMVMVPGPMG